MADYLQAGATLVWVLDPTPETVTEHRPNSPPRTLTKAESLTCDGIIPGFQLSMAELFRE